jgi:DNA invertase Pin-like site-specific DNA recombinase
VSFVELIMKKAIELIRVSTEGQAGEDRAGIPAQRAANRRTAQQHGLEIVRTIELADVSGASVLKTPEITELLRLMESPEIHGVVAKEFSRLMRPENFLDYGLLQTFADTHTILYLPEGPIDFASKSGRLMGTIRAAIAGLERTEILERVWSAKEEKRRKGEHPQSSICLPFGVGYEKQRGWFYKPEAEKIGEAVRLFLSGNASYKAVGERLGIDPFSLRIILRNPIYTGWRVYDKKRDPSASARRTTTDGRQADRPKIMRTEEEIIRVKVLDGLIGEQEWAQLQRLLDLKKERHWRTSLDYQHRFTYNGFLICGTCGNLVYTHKRRADYYVCKNRRLTRAGEGCKNPFMRREKLEPTIDSLFSEQLTDEGFLRGITDQFLGSREANGRDKVLRLQAELQAMKAKRERILGAYFDGVISAEERDRRIADVERDEKLYHGMLMREAPTMPVSASALAQVFAPFHEWEFLSREQKRRLLGAITPEIHVENYRVIGISMLMDAPHRNEISHTGKDSWPPPA